jgi:hypothetical protein
MIDALNSQAGSIVASAAPVAPALGKSDSSGGTLASSAYHMSNAGETRGVWKSKHNDYNHALDDPYKEMRRENSALRATEAARHKAINKPVEVPQAVPRKVRRAYTAEPVAPVAPDTTDALTKIVLAIKNVDEQEREERRKARQADEERKEKKDRISHMNIPLYTRKTGATFVHNLRMQIKMAGLNINDPDVTSALMNLIFTKLPNDLQLACKAENIPDMLKFLEGATETFKSAQEIINTLKKEASITNPNIMWATFRTYLKGVKRGRSDEQIAEEAWEGVRDAIYFGTPLHPLICGLHKPPTDDELEVVVSQ